MFVYKIISLDKIIEREKEKDTEKKKLLSINKLYFNRHIVGINLNR